MQTEEKRNFVVSVAEEYTKLIQHRFFFINASIVKHRFVYI